MDQRPDQSRDKREDKEGKPGVLPKEGITANPNPRANANLQNTEVEDTRDQKSSGVGSEITDGEDA